MFRGLLRLPEVSIIATVLNEAEDIGRLVESLTTQTFLPAQIIIVDGGSSDGTWEKLQRYACEHPILHVIRDETCNLKSSPGPIARGRNVAIRHAMSTVIACADAGCSYAPEWLERLTAPIFAGQTEYVLGGSYLDPASATIWDLAAAPFLGIKMRNGERTRSCTARSMAFGKDIWRRVGGFPENSLFGEDSLFDLRVREIVEPVFVDRAMACYRPRFTFGSAARTIARYAAADGTLGIRRSRLTRMSLRCLAETVVLALLPWVWWPALLVFSLEVYFALQLDVRGLLARRSFRALGARLLFSLLVPWICAWSYIKGAITGSNPPNLQNVSEPSDTSSPDSNQDVPLT